MARFETWFYARKEPYFSCPVSVDADHRARIRSDGYGGGSFGAPRNGGRKHEGLDFLVAVGDSVMASKSGRVTFAVYDPKGYVQYVELSHPDGRRTRYAHLSQTHVREGDWVVRGQVIGLTGKTGNAKNLQILPHLHFEIRDTKKALDPAQGLLDPSIQL